MFETKMKIFKHIQAKLVKTFLKCSLGKYIIKSGKHDFVWWQLETFLVRGIKNFLKIYPTYCG